MRQFIAVVLVCSGLLSFASTVTAPQTNVVIQTSVRKASWKPRCKGVGQQQVGYLSLSRNPLVRQHHLSTFFPV